MLRLFAQEFRQEFQGGKRRERSAHRLRSSVPEELGGWSRRVEHDAQSPAHEGAQT
jgi:hypothetical protein